LVLVAVAVIVLLAILNGLNHEAAVSPQSVVAEQPKATLVRSEEQASTQAPPVEQATAGVSEHITAIMANVRAAPSRSAAVLRTIPQGDEVIVVQTIGEWRRISLPGRPELGWIHQSVAK
jgi:SH3-like domain-containing protein